MPRHHHGRDRNNRRRSRRRARTFPRAETTTEKVPAAACRRCRSEPTSPSFSSAWPASSMFFMALTSSFLVRKGLGNDWVAFELPRILWVNTLVLLASSVTIQVARRHLHEDDEGRIQALVGAHDGAWACCFSVGQLIAWRQLAAQGVFLVDQSQQQLLLSADGAARVASGGRDPGVVVRLVSQLAAFAHHASDGGRCGLDLLAFHGWALGFSTRTSLPGTVNRARNEERWWVCRLARRGRGGGSPFAINSKKFGMWLFIVSDTLTFSALLAGIHLQPPGQSGLAAAV